MRVKEAEEPCPLCRNIEFSIFPDQALPKLPYSFKAAAIRTKAAAMDKGYDWSGELINFDNHLNYSYKMDCLLDGMQVGSTIVFQLQEYEPPRARARASQPMTEALLLQFVY